MKRIDSEGTRHMCAGCGAEIRPDWIIDDVICPSCMDRLNASGPSWDDVLADGARINRSKQD